MTNNDSEEHYIVTFSPLLADDNIQGVIGFMRNITDRFLMQKKLEENSKILEKKVREQIEHNESFKTLRKLNQELIDSAPIGIFVMDATGIVLSENPAIKKIAGYPDDSRVGYNLLEYEGFINAGFSDLFRKCVEERNTITIKNAPYMPISKSRFLVINLTLHPLIDQNGLASQVLLMLEDHTEQALMARKINWNDKVSSVYMLAGGVAAKLRRPINKMYMDLNFIWSNVDKDSRIAEYTTSMKNDLRRIRNISEQLLALSGTGPDKMDKELCQINKVLFTHPLDILINHMKEQGYNVDITLPETSPTLVATKKQMSQILFDLIENARDAMPDMGALKIHIEVIEVKDKSYCSIEVTDTGFGIPEEDIKNVFKPFFTTKGEDATGLGLMISSYLVESLGGFIGIKSAPGEGASVKITIPVMSSSIVEGE